MDKEMQTKIDKIKTWLGTGSINIFGLPFAGKDTVCKELAELLGAAFLSSGDIIRAHDEAIQKQGFLTPTNLFLEWVLPEFYKPEYSSYPLALSSIGRWHGEEASVLKALEKSGHPTKAVIFLDLPESEIFNRWQASQTTEDRAVRADDVSLDIIKVRISEFQRKTLPVLNFYQSQNLLTKIDANQPREKVLADAIDALASLAN